MSSRLGFRLELVGLAALARPVIASIILAAVTLIALISIALNIGFNGNMLDILKGDTQEYADFERLRTEFRDVSKDHVLLVRSDTLQTPEGFEQLRDLHLELQFLDQVNSVLSIFSMVEPDEEEQGWRSAIPAEIQSKEQLATIISHLIASQDAARNLISGDGRSALILLMPMDQAGQGADVSSIDFVTAVKDVTNTFKSETFHIDEAGLTAINIELVSAIIRDQLVLSTAGTIICAFIAYIVFRSVASAIICTLPPIFSVLWLLGFFALSGTRIDFLTTVIPVLVLVIAFADGLHLYFQWQRACADGQNPTDALTDAIRNIGPACALATLTTSIAFLSIGFGTSQALNAMAVIGAMGVFTSFIAVITVMPLAIHWWQRQTQVMTVKTPGLLVALNPSAIGAVTRFPRLIVLLSIGIGGAMMFVHLMIGATYRVIDYLPSPSDVRNTEAAISESFTGTAQIFLIVDAVQDGIAVSAADIEKVATAHEAMARVIGRQNTASIATPAALEIARSGRALFERMPEDGTPLWRQFVNADRSAFLITGFVSSLHSSADIKAIEQKIEQSLIDVGLETEVTKTGYPIFSAHEVTRLVDRLKLGLTFAVLISIIVVAIAFNSAALALACLIPNILPIFAVEALVWIWRGDMDVTIAVALTIAFGIAVDGSVHLLNQFRLKQEKQQGLDDETAMVKALSAITPALVATTLVLSAGLLVTLFSSLPMAILFGMVILTTLFIALLADIYLLPAMALAARRLTRKNGVTKS